MKKRIFLFMIVLSMITGGCSSLREWTNTSSVIINTKEDLYQEVQNALQEGKTEFIFETDELKQKDFDQLNLEHDGFYGSVEKYQINTIRFLHRSYITLYFNISDNYYVEDSFFYGTELSADQNKAAELKEACEMILSEIQEDSASEDQMEKRIHDYIVEHVQYGYPDNNENENSDAYNAYGALVRGKAVCNGYAQAMKLLCDLSGLECQMITGTADGENHAWNLICLDGEWYHTDVTWDDPEPDNPSRIFYSYFNLNDSVMEESHTWEKKEYPQAEGIKYNYFALNDLYCEDFTDFKEKCKSMFTHDDPNYIQILVGDYEETTYSEENLQFLFQYSGATSIHLQTAGKGKYTTLYITLQYD